MKLERAGVAEFHAETARLRDGLWSSRPKVRSYAGGGWRFDCDV